MSSIAKGWCQQRFWYVLIEAMIIIVHAASRWLLRRADRLWGDVLGGHELTRHEYQTCGPTRMTIHNQACIASVIERHRFVTGSSSATYREVSHGCLVGYRNGMNSSWILKYPKLSPDMPSDVYGIQRQGTRGTGSLFGWRLLPSVSITDVSIAREDIQEATEGICRTTVDS